MAMQVNARSALDDALANTEQVILLVLGDGPGFDQIVANADHAILFPEAQAAVWVRDLSILTQKEKNDYGPGDPTYVACALSRTPRQVRAQVSRPAAKTMIFMEVLTAAQEEQQPSAPTVY